MCVVTLANVKLQTGGATKCRQIQYDIFQPVWSQFLLLHDRRSRCEVPAHLGSWRESGRVRGIEAARGARSRDEHAESCQNKHDHAVHRCEVGTANAAAEIYPELRTRRSLQISYERSVSVPPPLARTAVTNTRSCVGMCTDFAARAMKSERRAQSRARGWPHGCRFVTLDFAASQTASVRNACNSPTE